MKFLIFASLIFSLFLTSCSSTGIFPASTTTSTATPTIIPTNTPAPTATPDPTPWLHGQWNGDITVDSKTYSVVTDISNKLIIAITKNGETFLWDNNQVWQVFDFYEHPLKWSEFVRQQFNTVISNPWRASQEEKQAFDDFVTKTWKLLLTASGKQNAEKLENNDLVIAIIEYCRKQGIREITLPFSSHRHIRTDAKNVVEYSVPPGRDPNVRDSYYGWMTNGLSSEAVLEFARFLDHFNFYGEVITRSGDVPFPTSVLFLEGDIALLFHLPGIEPDIAQGTLLTMIDKNGELHFAEFILTYKEWYSKETDLCEFLTPIPGTGNQQGSIESCEPDLPLTSHIMWRNGYPQVWNQRPITKEDILRFMEESKNTLHVEVNTWQYFKGRKSGDVIPVWVEGAVVSGSLVIISDVSFPK